MFPSYKVNKNKIKYGIADVYDELHNPAVAAANVLTGFAKRKDMLQPILEFALNMLNGQDANPRDQEGALRILGELFTALTKSKVSSYLFICSMPWL